MRKIGRRSLLASVVGAGAMAVADADTPQSKKAPRKLANPADLDRAAAAPVLKVDGLTSPVIIESMKLLKKDREYMVHVRSKDGAEGVSLTNPPRAQYLDPVFHWQGRARPGSTAARPLPLEQQLQDVRAGVVERTGVGRVRHSRHAGADRQQAHRRFVGRRRAAGGSVLRGQRQARHHAGTGDRVAQEAAGGN